MEWARERFSLRYNSMTCPRMAISVQNNQSPLQRMERQGVMSTCRARSARNNTPLALYT